MRHTKKLAGLAMAIGMLAGAGTLSAADLRDGYRGAPVVQYGNGYVDGRLAADQARLNQDIRFGRQDAAARDAADMARDQRAPKHEDWRYGHRDYRNNDRDRR
jgi:hypothetical protein